MAISVVNLNNIEKQDFFKKIAEKVDELLEF